MAARLTNPERNVWRCAVDPWRHALRPIGYALNPWGYAFNRWPHVAGRAAVAALLAICIACAPAGNPVIQDNVASQQLATLVADVWDRQIESSPFLRMQEGLPVTELPPLDYARAEDDAAYAQSVLEGHVDWFIEREKMGAGR